MPAENAAWWRRLSPERRARLLQERPAEIGSLDGLPSRVRDQANRSVLDSYLRDHEDPGSAALKRMIGGPEGDSRDRPLLLTYRPPSAPGGTDGLVAVSYGDPDRSHYTAVHVPGTGNNLNAIPHIRFGLDNARRLREHAEAPTGGRERTAAVYWLGCKMPDRIPGQATNTRYAVEGHPALTGFVSGLAVSKQIRGQTTVTGHSYGTGVVARAAASTRNFPADAILFQGSPGVGDVQKAEQLNVDPRRVFVMADKSDPVVHAPRRLLGTNPKSSSFRARALSTRVRGHSEYMKHGSLALSNTVNVVIGQWDRLVEEPRLISLYAAVAELAKLALRGPFPRNVPPLPPRRTPREPGPSLT
ncbi:alpha/beta hydrolase [Nocardiopsis sp. NPDC007018]|uniref:alpha/beta hydrolase n=1 Tax=Nocardiopsis sp. NPDC007018 TaxID=3155721 RepID=UPI0033FFD53A